MNNANLLSGIFAAAITPIKMDGELALDDLTLFLDFLARRGCHGALLLGTTGEGPSFSPSERYAILRASLSIRQDFPDFRLLAGTGTPSLDESIQLTREAFSLGFDGVVVLPPYFFRSATEDGLFSWYRQLIEQAVPEWGLFFVYHFPAMSGIDLSLEFLKRLKDYYPDRFAGLKDSSRNAQFVRQLGGVFAKDLLVYNGDDALFSLALENQAAGCITAMANLLSPDLRQLWDAYQQNTSYQDIHQKLCAYRQVMNQYMPFPPLYKSLLSRLHGFARWNLRPPLTPLAPALEKEVLRKLEETSRDLSASTL